MKVLRILIGVALFVPFIVQAENVMKSNIDKPIKSESKKAKPTTSESIIEGIANNMGINDGNIIYKDKTTKCIENRMKSKLFTEECVLYTKGEIPFSISTPMPSEYESGRVPCRLITFRGNMKIWVPKPPCPY